MIRSTISGRGAFLWIGIAGCLLSGPGGSGQFPDYAEVLSVEPIVESVALDYPQQHCQQRQLIYADSEAVAGSIGADIRRRGRLLRNTTHCRPEPHLSQRTQITGYWVTYRYQGRAQMRRMDHDPGDRLAVNVRLQPVP